MENCRWRLSILIMALFVCFCVLLTFTQTPKLLDPQSPNISQPAMVRHAYSAQWLRWMYMSNNTNTPLKLTHGTYVQPTAYSGIHRLPGYDFSLAIYIRTSAKEGLMRQAVRETWMSDARALGMTVVFVAAIGIGDGVKEPANVLMLLEAHEHHDMLVFNSFTDAYHNLSLKTRECMRWHQANAQPHVPTVFMWTNMDGMVFPIVLLKLIVNRRIANQSNAIHGQCNCSGKCREMKGGAPERFLTSKYYMPKTVYANNEYPQYCAGFTILMSPDTVDSLLTVANTKSEQWLIDNYMDGVTYAGMLRVESTTPITLQDYSHETNPIRIAGLLMSEDCGKFAAMLGAGNVETFRQQYIKYSVCLALGGGGESN